MSKMRKLKEAAAWIEDTKKRKWFCRREEKGMARGKRGKKWTCNQKLHLFISSSSSFLRSLFFHFTVYCSLKCSFDEQSTFCLSPSLHSFTFVLHSFLHDSFSNPYSLTNTVQSQTNSCCCVELNHYQRHFDVIECS